LHAVAGARCAIRGRQRRPIGLSKKENFMQVGCRKMTRSRRKHADALLNAFLRHDVHYLKTSARYGDQGPHALERALELFLRRKELGFVWLAYASGEAVGACVVSYAISTSVGGLVAKLDDVCVVPHLHRRGIASGMLRALAKELKKNNVGRIDTSAAKGNHAAERLYRKLGFKALGEERLVLVLRRR
jgi:ribosomal protein S18 acetylase RimI-like enzyme